MQISSVATRIAIVSTLKLSLAALALISVSAANGSASPSEKELKNIAERMQQNKQRFIEAETEKRKILGSLYSMQKRLKKITQEKSQLTDELFRAQDSAKGIAKIIASLELEIAKQRKVIKTRLRAIYKVSGESYMAILFSQKTPQQLDETLRFLKIIADSDYKLLKSYQENVEVYRAQKERLKNQVERLVGIESKIKSQETLIAKEHQSKMKIVSELDKKRSASLSDLRNLRIRSVSSDEIDELLKPSIFEKKGQLPAPVEGKIARDFGLIENEKYKIVLSHKGLGFETIGEAPVSAVFAGQVVFSEKLPGYGETIVIDHGDHYFTVYSHLTRIVANKNQQVKTGQVIAHAGEIDDGLANGIYFEIRHFSEPENPRLWLEPRAGLNQQANSKEPAIEPELASNKETPKESMRKPQAH